MNENIKQLAQACGFYIYDMSDIDGQDLGMSIETSDPSTFMRYTQAIIDECVSSDQEKLKLYIKYGI